MAIKEIQIHQLPEVDKITNENVFAVEVGTTTYKVTGQTLINFIKTHSEIKNIYIDKELIGVNNGIVPINSDGKIDSQYISYGNVSGTSYEGSSGKLLEDELTAHKQDSSNPHGVDKEQVGLGNVENKSSEDIRGELTFDNVTKALGFTPEIDGSYENSVAYTDKAITDLIGGAEEDLNTLKELSDAIKESKSVVEALNEAIGKKANEAEFDSHVKDTAVHLSSTDRESITTSLKHAQSDHARSDATKTERSTTNGNIKINGTETTVYQHPISGVTAGTYRQVTVDSQGHITGGNNTTLPLTQGGTGATTAAQALSNLGISATAEELNKLDGATVSVTEINQLKGVISPIQEQLNGKALTSHGNHVPDVTSDSSGAVIMSDGTNYEWKKLKKQDIVDALGYVPGTGSIVYTSVKGDAETEYRTGEVNITKENIGLGKVDNTSDNEKSVLSATKLSNTRKIGNASFDGTKDIALSDIGALATNGDSKDNTVSFTSSDSTTATAWTDVSVLSNNEKHSSIFNKISTMFKNIRYLYNMLGTTDISNIGDGTATGAISTLNSNLAQNKKNSVRYGAYESDISLEQAILKHMDDMQEYVPYFIHGTNISGLSISATNDVMIEVTRYGETGKQYNNWYRVMIYDNQSSGIFTITNAKGSWNGWKTIVSAT